MVVSEGKVVVFDTPPVTEVALGVVFAPLEKLRAIHLGLFWQSVRDVFRDAEQQPPIPRYLEETGGVQGGIPQPFPFLFGGEQRNTLASSDKTRLLQLQRDRFVCNWRKTAASQKYPGYDADLRPTFARYWESFSRFLESNSLGTPQVDQCDVEYIDDIPQGEGWETADDVRNIIAPWTGSFSRPGLIPAIESLNILMSFAIPERRGRVYLSLQPVTLPSIACPVLRITVSARVVPVAGYARDVLNLLDVGHEWAVKTFLAFTTPAIQARWGVR